MDGAFKAHYLERTLDSKPWPCDYGDAQWVNVRPPKEPSSSTPPLPPSPPSVQAFVAEAEVSPNQIQDLAESLGAILTAAAGREMKFKIRIELEHKAAKTVVNQVNELLKEITAKLKLE